MKTILPACLILVALTAFGQSDFTRDDAIRKVIHEVIVPPTLDHHVTAFLTMQPLKPGDVIDAFLDGRRKVIRRPTWFAWINDNADAFFAHPTRYVFIDAQSGDMQIEHYDWWPVLNDISLFMTDAERRDLDLIVYSDLHHKKVEDH